MNIKLLRHMRKLMTLSTMIIGVSLPMTNTSQAKHTSTQEPTLIIYTSSGYTSSYGPTKFLSDLFYKNYHAKIKWVGLDGGTTILTRLRLEGKNSKADMVAEMSDPIIQMLNKKAYLQQIDPQSFPPIAINKNAYDSTHYIPMETGQLAFVYNNTKIKNPPKTIEELAHSTYKIIIEDPRFSGTGLSFLYWVDTIYKDKTSSILQKLMTHTITQKTWDNAYNLFLKGESDFVLSYATSPAYHILEEQNHNYSATMFTHGNLETNYYAGILKTSKHTALAKKFIQMILSSQGQEILSRKNYALPVIAGKVNVNKALLKYKNKQLSLTPTYISTNKKRLKTLWLNLPR